MLFDNDDRAVAHILPNRTGGSCVRRDHAYNGTVFFILLQVRQRFLLNVKT